MQFKALIKTTRQGYSSRTVMYWIFASLMLAQTVLILFDGLAYKNDLYESVRLKEQVNLSSALSNLNSATKISKLQSNGSLSGTNIVNTVTGEQYQLGERFETADATWIIETLFGRYQVLAYLNFSAANIKLGEYVLKKLMMALLVSLSIAGMSLILSYKFFTDPLAKITRLLKKNREDNEAGLQNSSELGVPSEFSGLVDEYNLIINEEREAIRQVKIKQKYLEYIAHHDPLTHLPNRLFFESKLQQMVAESLKRGEAFAMFLIDIDNFKFFNDQYGHNVGDQMVKELAERLTMTMRKSDAVARLDGDEFVVLQRDITDIESTKDTAQRILNLLSESFDYVGFTLKTNTSIGISLFPDDVHLEQGSNAELEEELFNNATFALQKAKANGRAQFQVFTESMRNSITERITLEEDIKSALVDGQFEVYYQPKINMQTCKVIGSEALVRWNHPTLGSIRPDIFIPVAEESGSIIALGEWILRTACRQTQQLIEEGYGSIQVAVNISAVQFTAGKLLTTVKQILEETGLSATSLELEITESAVMHDPKDVIRTLHELSSNGIKLAIDDFGTGYSSLAYLKRFPVDTLKIDQAFIRDISSDSDDAEIVGAILSLGKYFGLKIVAEGVEEEEQLNFLRSQGCDIAQGYYVSKPLPFSAFTEWLEQQGARGQDNVSLLEARQ